MERDEEEIVVYRLFIQRDAIDRCRSERNVYEVAGGKEVKTNPESGKQGNGETVSFLSLCDIYIETTYLVDVKGFTSKREAL